MKQLFSAARDSRVTLLAGALFGALTGVYPATAAAILAVLTAIVFGISLMDHRKARKRIEIREDEVRRLLRPQEGASRAAGGSNYNLLVSGGTVEVVTHPSLNTATRLVNVGWDLRDVGASVLDENFEACELMKTAGGRREYEPPNSRKYCLVNTPFVSEESPSLSLDLRETDYFTVQTSRELFDEQPGLLESFGDVLPHQNRVPHSLCLHYTVRTSGGEVLCLKRAAGMAYHTDRWSISGEEQLSELDLKHRHPVEMLFKRALCEELLHLRNADAMADMLSLLEEQVKFLRITSIGVEWPLYNPTLFGIAQLAVDADNLRQTLQHRKLGLDSGGEEDREGAISLLDAEEAIRLLRSEGATATGLFDGREVHLAAEDLHPTSRYRLFRLMRATSRSALIP